MVDPDKREREKKQMQNAWSELVTITDEVYRSQLGDHRETAKQLLAQADNKQEELLLEAVMMIVTLRNRE